MSLFDFDSIDIQITPHEILELFTEEQLYRQYYPDFKLGTCNSPFRTDNNPSFRFWETTQDYDYQIWWGDQKTGESGTVFQFLRKCYEHFFNMKLSLREVYNQVYKDMDGATLSKTVTTPIRNTPRAGISRPKATPPVLSAFLYENEQGIPEFLPEMALAYWEQYGINRNILEAYNVGYATEIWIIRYKNGERQTYLWFKSIPGCPVYFYFFPESKHMKGYRPLEKDKKRKWISNVNNSQDIQGWTQCMQSPNTDLLVLTKSMKDVMWLRTIGVDSMAIHGENHGFNPEQIEALRKKYDVIISVYDNDWAGMRGALKLRKLYGIPCHFIPRQFGAKDITDLYKLNKVILFELIDQLKEFIDANHNTYSRVSDAAA